MFTRHQVFQVRFFNVLIILNSMLKFLVRNIRTSLPAIFQIA